MIPKNLEKEIKKLIRCCTADLTTSVTTLQAQLAGSFTAAKTLIGTTEAGDEVYTLLITKTAFALGANVFHALNVKEYLNVFVSGSLTATPTTKFSTLDILTIGSVDEDNLINLSGWGAGTAELVISLTYTQN